MVQSGENGAKRKRGRKQSRGQQGDKLERALGSAKRRGGGQGATSGRQVKRRQTGHMPGTEEREQKRARGQAQEDRAPVDRDWLRWTSSDCGTFSAGQHIIRTDIAISANVLSEIHPSFGTRAIGTDYGGSSCTPTI